MERALTSPVEYLSNPALSEAQMKALSQFAQHGGHGYGENAYLSTATAKSLAKAGLVRLGWRRSGTKDISWGLATEAGIDILDADPMRAAFHYSIPPEPYGWTPAPVGWLPR